MRSLKELNLIMVFCFIFTGKCLKCDDRIDLEEPDNGLYDLWETRKQNSIKGIFEAQQMYKEIERRQHTLSELHQSTRRFLQQENANLLAEILSANESTIHLEKLNTVYDELKSNYDSLLVEDIFQEALEQVYRSKSPEQLMNDLYEIYKPPNDIKSFEVMVKVQLILNAIHRTKSYQHHEYLQGFALILYKIKNNRLLRSLDNQLRDGLDKAIGELPDYLKYFLFKPYFCMLNVAYSEFIYTAVNSNINRNSRYIWLWYDTNNIDATGHIKADLVDGNDTNFNKFKVTLKGTAYNVYYYMMDTQANTIAGWQSTDKDPFNYVWTVQFISDKVALYQNGYIMCSVDRYDGSRRNVNGYGFNGTEFNANNPSCQWSIGNCDRR